MIQIITTVASGNHNVDVEILKIKVGCIWKVFGGKHPTNYKIKTTMLNGW